MYLYEQIEQAKNFGAYKELPKYIPDNLNPSFELRPYQKDAFCNFITYFENEALCRKPTQTLFHMATGSGKTLIMAGLMLYLFKQGYRNFLFFVNLSNIVQKTKENFLNRTSSKYLFADEINIDGEKVKIREVNNFQASDPNAINICFTTIQGLHSDIWFVKENSVSIDDFRDNKIVLISDEAHHLNVDTRRGNKEEIENYRSWESTVKSIFEMNNQNVLLEFTATCDLANENIKREYENKIIFDYPLKKFRDDGYSKEIRTMRSDISIMERALQAIVLSQYRLKIFEDFRIRCKPVVLFKAKTIAESKAFMKEFIDTIKNLNGSVLERLADITEIDTMKKVYSYFEKNGITFEQLAQELKEAFGEDKCLSVNEDAEAEKNQIIVNSLEDANNPYRAIFEVRKLDEGWDVLNLFDIVRLYETRDAKNGIPGKTTIAEAQLIGRGARYYPFKLEEWQNKYQRKFDKDLDHPLRICEELYYHCQNESRYIAELYRALKEIGIDMENTVTRTYKLKDEFKADPLYQQGYVFYNERLIKSRSEVTGLSPTIRNHTYDVTIATGRAAEDTLMLGEEGTKESSVTTYTKHTSFAEIARINYSIVHRALRKYDVFKFNRLKSYFPQLKSINQFIFDDKYLGNVKIDITSRYEDPSPAILYVACVNVLKKIATSISNIEETYEGSKTFMAKYIREVFKDKRVNYTNPTDGGLGVSQNDNTVPMAWKLDLSKEDWFVFEDNYGTSEEKAFIAYFKQYVDKLKAKYDKVYLIRNERQLAIYSFDGGERFEPDYLLFLHSPKVNGYEQLQIFIEPKGTHLVKNDSWKEDFLLQLESNAIPIVKFADDNNYRIWGFHFFNRDLRRKEFDEDMNRLL
ncbi:MAG: DEAD/DEAH box helicase family protein [Caldicoprobacterales bacterium]|uniref:DEAD/DEAH box helicase family protein n=1 Tax=Tepidanaerobacter sp. GT38 TaxID=2722793 RepID=UPI001B4EB616|nr:DEAD/DEAH box helicase family protein [Prolixibacteraceae bacterium]MCG1011171.1 DEAD/DEAH box helicase family protein [Tepidanaerobacter sp. GT38]HOH96064.1 DEAD/DEAH box helicase family protein [Candidatus Enterocola sp.]